MLMVILFFFFFFFLILMFYHDIYMYIVGYERFLGPEMFFNPEIFSSDFLTPLPEVIDTTVQVTPFPLYLLFFSFSFLICSFFFVSPAPSILVVGCIRTLSSLEAPPCLKILADACKGIPFLSFLSFSLPCLFIVLFVLHRDIKRAVDDRIARSEKLSGGKIKSAAIDVNVVSHHMQRYAVWFGGIPSFFLSFFPFFFFLFLLMMILFAGSMLASTPEFFSVCHTKKVSLSLSFCFSLF